jgi:spore coat protein U-like protein
MKAALARWWLAAVLVAGSASAAEAACTISATSVAFGTYDVFQTTPTDSTGTVTFRCSNSDKDIRITISAGSSGSFTQRTLRRGTEGLAYNLFPTAALTFVWGNGTGGTWTYFNHNPQNNRDIVLTIYARIPAEQDVSAGSYSDSVVVTLEY